MRPSTAADGDSFVDYTARTVIFSDVEAAGKTLENKNNFNQ